MKIRYEVLGDVDPDLHTKNMTYEEAVAYARKCAKDWKSASTVWMLTPITRFEFQEPVEVDVRPTAASDAQSRQT